MRNSKMAFLHLGSQCFGLLTRTCGILIQLSLLALPASAEMVGGTLQLRGSGLICQTQNNSSQALWITSIFYQGSCTLSDGQVKLISGTSSCEGSCSLAPYFIVGVRLGYDAAPPMAASCVGSCFVNASAQ